MYNLDNSGGRRTENKAMWPKAQNSKWGKKAPYLIIK